MSQTLRTADTNGEAAVAAYLDKYFYPKYCQNTERKSDKASQLAGVDIIFDLANQQHLMTDEKAMLHYINKNIPTFAFELSFLNINGKLSQGWLFDSTKRTAYYLLTWITAKKDKHINCDDIIALEIIIVSREAIIKMLQRHNFDKVSILQKAQNIRDNNEIRQSGKTQGQPFYFFFTEFLAEKPINVIIHKAELIRLATAHFPKVSPT